MGAVAYFTCSRPGSAPTDFLANINWVDGSMSTGKIVSDGVGGYCALGAIMMAGREEDWDQSGSNSSELLVE